MLFKKLLWKEKAQALQSEKARVAAARRKEQDAEALVKQTELAEKELARLRLAAEDAKTAVIAMDMPGEIPVDPASTFSEEQLELEIAV